MKREYVSKDTAAVMESTLATEPSAGVSNAKNCEISNIHMLDIGMELRCNGGS